MDYPGDEAPRLSVLVGFNAMRHFLDAYWQRGDRQSDEIAMLLGDLNSQMTLDGSPADPAQWSDWLEAVEKAEADFKGLAD